MPEWQSLGWCTYDLQTHTRKRGRLDPSRKTALGQLAQCLMGTHEKSHTRGVPGVQDNKQPKFTIPRIDCFSSLYNDEDLADVTVRTGSKKFHAHRAVLSAHSAYFKTMFTVRYLHKGFIS